MTASNAHRPAALAAFDWNAAAEDYFEDPRGRFTAAEKRRVAATGAAAVDAIARVRREQRLRAAGGATLVVGAGAAELPMIAAEAALGRRVVAWTLRKREALALAAACAGARSRVTAAAADALRAAPPTRVDHLWIVSVLNDPEAFPALHEFYYQRAAPRTFSGRRFDADRARARRIVARLCGRLRTRALVTCSDDAWPWLEEWAESAGARLEASERLWRAPLTRDPVRCVAVLRAK